MKGKGNGMNGCPNKDCDWNTKLKGEWDELNPEDFYIHTIPHVLFCYREDADWESRDGIKWSVTYFLEPEDEILGFPHTGKGECNLGEMRYCPFCGSELQPPSKR